MKMFIVVVFALVSFACGLPTDTKSDADSRIAGGRPAFQGQFPYQVSLQIGNSHFCGGSIIDERWILTAAHCFDQAPKPVYWTVYYGSNMLDYGGNRISVRRLVPHPSYNMNVDNEAVDLALVELEGRIFIEQGVVETIPLETSPKSCERCAVAGWGYTNPPFQASNVLQYLNVKADICRIPPQGIIALCQLSTSKLLPLDGDSGSPLVQDKKQIGIMVSTSPEKDCTEQGCYAYYCIVSDHIPWITSVIHGY